MLAHPLHFWVPASSLSTRPSRCSSIFLLRICGSLCLYLTITPTILETPRTSRVPVCIADSRGLLAFSRDLWPICSNTSHASKGFHYILFYSIYGAACYVFAYD